MKTQTLTEHKNSSPHTFLERHFQIRNDSKIVQRSCYISTQFFNVCLFMYALYYLYEWNSLRTQPKMEMTLSKNNALLIGNGLKSRRINCYGNRYFHGNDKQKIEKCILR